MTTTSTTAKPTIDFNEPALVRHRKKRKFKDQLAKVVVGIGGISVILAITMIFFYLLYEVAPLFRDAEAQAVSSYPVPEAQRGTVLYRTIEEQGEVAMQLMSNGDVVFFQTQDGSVVSTPRLNIPNGVTVTSFNNASATSRLVMVGLSNGQVLLFQHNYKLTYPDNKRVITPEIAYPYGTEPLVLDPKGAAITFASAVNTDDALLIVGTNEIGRAHV